MSMDINTPKSLPSHFRSSPPHTSDSTTNSTPSLKSVDISSDEAINPIHIAPALGELNSAPSFRRARELYKYFHPLTFSSKTPQNDTFDALLSSQAQLVAGRLGGKCLINLLDSLRQYVVAEAVGSPSRTPERPSARVSELEAVNWVDVRLSRMLTRQR